MNISDLNSRIDWKKVGGMIPAVVQNDLSGEVLMVGYMNAEALDKTAATKTVTFWSRTRNALWTKGETSGNILNLVSMHLDCDSDALLVTVDPVGSTCHRKTLTCFSNNVNTGASENPSRDTKQAVSFLPSLTALIHQRKYSTAEDSYVKNLLEKPNIRVLQKVGEEAVEFILAATDSDRAETLNEAADLMFHFLVALEKKEISFNEVLETLRRRRKT